ncbi:hypothetical protein NM688_g2005 [Phlebia brevispora]|uniref:Uncharacterized protein n=1 Tax=Phlebia brevispora TaxID=194682 RepID=A0ACC1T9Q5_9APHY|nr:hypothetical protein NM688_g2005 [Phlebia brevispora]
MAASPVAVNGSGNVQDNEKWISQEMPVDAQPPANGAEVAAGPGSRPDDHHEPPSQSSERKEGTPSTTTASGGKLEVPHRGEKQIKVLVWS